MHVNYKSNSYLLRRQRTKYEICRYLIVKTENDFPFEIGVWFSPIRAIEKVEREVN